MRVDIIIPTYKPDDTFCLLLQKLQEQTFVIHELILVNTEEALWNEAVRKYPIEQIRKELPFSSRIFHMTRENFDHGGARNMGAGYSEADILSACPIQPQDNLLTADTEAAALAIEQKLPYVGEATVKRKFPSRIVVTVSEAEKLMK